MSHETVSSRRKFLGTGAAALGGLGLLGLGAAPARAARSDAAGKLFAAPINSEGEYQLPDLPYAYDALEPHIDEQTMRLHHDIHFEGYRKGLNKALFHFEEARRARQFEVMSYWEGQLAFNGSGYLNHLVFFQNMAPAGKTRPSRALKTLVGEHFGSLEAFRDHFGMAAKTAQGSGWALLGYEPAGAKMVILQPGRHQNEMLPGVLPILALDVWEHAYYLKYQNRRGDYVANWWNVVNWENVEERAEAALSL